MMSGRKQQSADMDLELSHLEPQEQRRESELGVT